VRVVNHINADIYMQLVFHSLRCVVVFPVFADTAVFIEGKRLYTAANSSSNSTLSSTAHHTTREIRPLQLWCNLLCVVVSSANMLTSSVQLCEVLLLKSACTVMYN
jgi:Mg2+/citrate symporter